MSKNTGAKTGLTGKMAGPQGLFIVNFQPNMNM